MKMIALVFILLMFGSTFTYALLNAFGEKNTEVQIPQDKILSYALNEQQKQYLLSKGYTLLEYSYPTGCLECIDVKKDLEKTTQISDDQVYLQELTNSGEVSKLTILSLNGGKTINNPTIKEAETSVCDLLIKKSLWCITSAI